MKDFNLNRLKAHSQLPAIAGDMVVFTENWKSASGIKIRKGHIALVLWAGQHTTPNRSYGAVKIKVNGHACIIQNRFVQKASSQN